MFTHPGSHRENRLHHFYCRRRGTSRQVAIYERIEVSWTAGETAEFRHGFEDCLDLVEDILGNITRLKQLKSYLLTVRASMKGEDVVRIREGLGL